MHLRYGKEFDMARHQACRAKGLVTASEAAEAGQAGTCEEHYACISLFILFLLMSFLQHITICL